MQQINRVEEFYPKMEKEELQDLTKSIDKFSRLVNDNRPHSNELEVNAVKKEKRKVYSKYVIDDLNRLILKLAEEKTFLFKTKTGIEELIKNCENEVSCLDSYLNFKEYTPFKAEYDKSALDKVRFSTENLNDPKLNAFVKAKPDPKHGKVINAAIAEGNWTIKKSLAGISTYKVITYNTSVKTPDGSCKNRLVLLPRYMKVLENMETCT